MSAATPKLAVSLVSIGMPHDGRTLAERSLGGSETAAIHVAQQLAARGHRVTVFAPLPERQFDGRVVKGGVMQGVAWRDISEFQQFAVSFRHDVCIVSREINLAHVQALAPIRVLWCHDLALKRARGPVNSLLWQTNALYVLSEFQKRQYQEVYQVPEGALFVTRNGIDVSAFQRLRSLPRDPHKLVFGSRPERGLEACLLVMERLAAQGSPLRLEVSSYDDAGLAPQLRPYYQSLFERASRLPNVVIKGALPQGQWHEQLATARVMLYPGTPGDFREISHIGAMECQAAGTPAVVIGKGATPTTLNGAGIVVGDEATEPHSPAHIEAFTDAVQRLTRDEMLWQRLHQKALENAPGLDWSGVATQWEAHWLSIFAARTGDPKRMRAHFLREGDHEALRELGLGE